MKIIVVSDNHANRDVLNKILIKYPDADYYFHLGDSEMEKDELAPFCTVKGNMDYDYNLPNERVIKIGEISVYLTHGHIYSSSEELLSKQAKSLDCSLVLYGHTHKFSDHVVNGIRIINPGSCSRSKDSNGPSFALINIDNKGYIDCNKISINQ